MWRSCKETETESVNESNKEETTRGDFDVKRQTKKKFTKWHVKNRCCPINNQFM